MEFTKSCKRMLDNRMSEVFGEGTKFVGDIEGSCGIRFEKVHPITHKTMLFEVYTHENNVSDLNVYEGSSENRTLVNRFVRVGESPSVQDIVAILTGSIRK